MKPDETAAYFEAHSQDYHPRRLRVATSWITRRGKPGDSGFDIGCGTGLVLQAMHEAGITVLAGCDIASSALEVAAERVTFDAHIGSVLDDEFVTGLGTYQFVTMAAVLHHVVEPTRKASRVSAEHAMRNALSLVGSRGRLIIMEPTYRPRWAMTALFWTKRLLVSVFGNRRLELGKWNNLGAPIVAYYSPAEVVDIVEAAGGKVLRQRNTRAPLRLLPRLVGVRASWYTTVMAIPNQDSPHT